MATPAFRLEQKPFQPYCSNWAEPHVAPLTYRRQTSSSARRARFRSCPHPPLPVPSPTGFRYRCLDRPPASRCYSCRRTGDRPTARQTARHSSARRDNENLRPTRCVFQKSRGHLDRMHSPPPRSTPRHSRPSRTDLPRWRFFRPHHALFRCCWNPASHRNRLRPANLHPTPVSIPTP